MKKTTIAFTWIILFGTLISCKSEPSFDVGSFERGRVLELADKYLGDEPVTITQFKAERSAGSIHDFYSEGDYWWPDPQNPEGPYIRRDGLTNPENFTAHRLAMREFSIKVAALVAAYKITGQKKYAEAALKNLDAWFINENTMMSPHMLFAQAIHGRATGRGIGIIDTIHLVEVAQAITVLKESGYLNQHILSGLNDWFNRYNLWLTTHEFGIQERDNGNNHSTCWVMQVGMYAKLTENDSLMSKCREIYKNNLLPDQMAVNGSFPLELDRTKPYGYSLFNLDAMTAVCQILSNDDNNLWQYKTVDEKNIKQAVEFMYPFIKDKSLWPYQKDVMYFDEWPVRQPSLLFAGMAFNENKYVDLWKTLEPDPATEEIIRNYPIRQPVLWY